MIVDGGGIAGRGKIRRHGVQAVPTCSFGDSSLLGQASNLCWRSRRILRKPWNSDGKGKNILKIFPVEPSSGGGKARTKNMLRRLLAISCVLWVDSHAWQGPTPRKFTYWSHLGAMLFGQ